MYSFSSIKSLVFEEEKIAFIFIEALMLNYMWGPSWISDQYKLYKGHSSKD